MTPHLVFTSIVETEAVINAIIQCKQALFARLIRRTPQSCFLNPAVWLDAMHHSVCQCQSLDRNLPVRAPFGAAAQGLAVMTPSGTLRLEMFAMTLIFPVINGYGQVFPMRERKLNEFVVTGLIDMTVVQYEWMTMGGFGGVSVLIKCLQARIGMATGKCTLPLNGNAVVFSALTLMLKNAAYFKMCCVLDMPLGCLSELVLLPASFFIVTDKEKSLSAIIAALHYI